ncbi:ABC transporter permease [Luteococcus sp. OSA5]|uniref:ABC transporter permease n=1 Tax=unclassified Luteococcus TaxID=2639923 RepID=UPI003B4287DF
MTGFLAMVTCQLKVVMSRPMNLVTGLVSPAMWMVLVMLPRLDRLTPEQATQAFSGVLLASFWGASLWSGAGIIRRERQSGTLGVSFTGRLSPLMVLVGKTVGGVLYDTCLILATNTAFVLALGIPLRVASPMALAVGLLTVLAGGVASSLMIGACLMLTKHAFQLTTAVGAPVLFFAGTIIPYDQLPTWVAWVGSVLNISWLQRFLASTATHPRWDLWAAAAGISVLYALVGAKALQVLLRRARKEATLELG